MAILSYLLQFSVFSITHEAEYDSLIIRYYPVLLIMNFSIIIANFAYCSKIPEIMNSGKI